MNPIPSPTAVSGAAPAPHSANQPRYAYDVFLSHNHAEKPWVRALAGWLADQEYNGRRLRPWMDERFLDPGGLSGQAELTTAMDRSRLLALVLSPGSAASPWVDLELRYFLGRRGADAVVPLLRSTCTPPAALQGLPVLDFTGGEMPQEALRRLYARLCPPAPVRMDEVERGVDAAFAAVEASDPATLGTAPTPECDALLAELLRFDIDDAASEGFALAAFMRAAEHAVRLHGSAHPLQYEAKLLLAECLAAALCRSTGYRQVAQRFVDAAADLGEPALLTVVTRTYSKLAETDARRVDAGVLLRIAAELDRRDGRNPEVRTVQANLARVAGKLRDEPRGELLIKTLCGGDRASRIAAAGAIAFGRPDDGPVFYLSAMRDRFQARGEHPALPADPPSRRLLEEMVGLQGDEDPLVVEAVAGARVDLAAAYPGTQLPGPRLSWLIRRRDVDPAGLNNAPFLGTVARATLANMEAVSEDVDVATVVCLTEPRIVDALFDHAGGLLLPRQNADSPQLRRLRDRGIPFAMLEDRTMAELRDGEYVVVDRRGLGIWKG